MQSHIEIIDKLRQKLDPLINTQNVGAAVALLLRAANRDLRILLVKRADKPLDPWSGQMAFPGGKCDLKDQNPVQTVIRETLEETGIDLEHNCKFLGVLETTQSTVKPELLVAPFVIFLHYNPILKLNEELEGFLWISLRTLWKNKGAANLSFGEVPAYIVKGRVIWGLTYRILEKLSQILGETT